MTRPNNSRGRKTKSGRQNQTLHQDLIKTNRILVNQDERTMPSIPDVQEMFLSKNNLINLRLTTIAGNITTSSSSATNGAISVALSSFSLYPSLGNCFDSFRIMQVKVVFTPLVGPGSSVPLYTALDYTDAGTTADSTTLVAYDTVQITPAGRLTERIFTPHVNFATTVTGLSEKMPAGTWLTTANGANTNHYGLKYSVPASTSPVAYAAVTITAFFQFRNSI